MLRRNLGFQDRFNVNSKVSNIKILLSREKGKEVVVKNLRKIRHEYDRYKLMNVYNTIKNN